METEEEVRVKIANRVKELRSQFAATGRPPFKHFFCPILCEDTKEKLCIGHILPESVGGTHWLPQVEHLDNWYGRVAEANFGHVTKHFGRSIFDILADKKANKAFDPWIELGGRKIEIYFPDDIASVPPYYTVGKLKGEDVSLGAIENMYVVFKISPAELDLLNESEGQGIIEKDFRPLMAASVMKAAHLTMFYFYRYSYLFSTGGSGLAEILRNFYLQNRSKPQPEAIAAMTDYFLPFSWMIKPSHDIRMEGTIDDRQVLVICNEVGPYAICVVVKAFKHKNLVLLPASDHTLNAYDKLRTDPPASVKVRECLLTEDGCKLDTHEYDAVFQPNT